ncbi:MAG TPA: ABC transporter substrate-binding protein [Candidatus Dormibacteraeota bacterium]|nr:ABC transporter substrate-binding protein [Candidatus Dormibacteraeota bacterium]
MAEVLARLSSRAIALGLGTLLLVAACSSGGGGGGGGGASTTDVTVWTAWGGAELKAFRDVLAPFTQKTGIKVHVTTNRDSTNQIANGIAAGTDLPDIAPGPTDPVQVKDWVSKGALKPLETVLGASFQSYVSNTYPALTTAPGGASDDPYIGIIGGKHYEMMVKTQVKGLIWYNKKVFTGTAPKSFDDLLAINPKQYNAQSLFCAGFESGAASGWPASDQIDNIIMRQSGDQVYTNWIQGKVKFSSPEIKLGYETFLKEVSDQNVFGGRNTALSTNFGKAGDPLFKSPAGCLFLEQATFITAFFQQDFPSLNLKAGTDFDFFAHPSVNSQFDGNVNGFYDNFAMYNDTPAARQLMQYMSTADAQQIWANDGGTLGAIKSLNYTDPVFKRAADIAGSAKNLLVTAGDFMPNDMQKAFWQSLLNVTRDPGSLNAQLAHLDQVQAASYKSA